MIQLDLFAPDPVAREPASDETELSAQQAREKRLQEFDAVFGPPDAWK